MRCNLTLILDASRPFEVSELVIPTMPRTDEPAPCPAFGIRVTRPEIIHGSTPFSNRRRRTLNPWYSGILESYQDLVGRRKWTDPQVLKERDILLGDDDEKARVYIEMITRYREAYGQLEEIERKFFGEHSYFYCQEHGRYSGN